MNYNHYIVTFCLLLLSSSLFAQVGIGTTSPDISSILDLNSTTKGLLVPRMTLAERNAIESPTQGLLVYQNDEAVGFWYYDGADWIPFISGTDAWRISGNSGTSEATNFIGTTDSVSFVTKTNGTERSRITGNGDMGLGTSNPSQKLEVMNGNVLINNNNNTSGEIQIAEPSSAGTNYTSFKSGDQSEDIVYTLPTVQGGVNSGLVNDGTGKLSWGTVNSDFKQKASDQTIVNSTTLVDDNDLFFNVSANRTYIITALISAECDNTGGIRAQFSAPAGSSEFMYVFANKTGGDEINYITDPLAATDIVTTTLSPVDNVIVVNGTLITGPTAGVFKLRWAQKNAVVKPSTLKAGSYISISIVK